MLARHTRTVAARSLAVLLAGLVGGCAPISQSAPPPTGSAGSTPAAASVAPSAVAPTPSLRPTSPRSTPGTAFSRTFTFIDEAAGHSLIVSIDREARDGGHFAFQIAGRSVVSALGTLTADPRGSLALGYDGPATLMPTVSLTAPTASPAFSPRPVTISLRATIDPVAHVADATLSVDADRYVLSAHLPGTADIPALLDRIEAALLADDPLAVYPNMSTDITGSLTADAFAATWRAQTPSVGRVVGLTRGEIGPVEMLDEGFPTVRVAYVVQRSSILPTEMVLIHQRAGWKLWFSSER